MYVCTVIIYIDIVYIYNYYTSNGDERINIPAAAIANTKRAVRAGVCSMPSHSKSNALSSAQEKRGQAARELSMPLKRQRGVFGGGETARLRGLIVNWMVYIMRYNILLQNTDEGMK